MKSTTLVQLIALPATLAANFAELYVLAGADDPGMRVTGKKDPDAEVTQMNSSTPGFDQNIQCLLDDGTWSRWGCLEKPMYRQVGQFNFPKVTEDPRTFVVDFNAQRPRAVFTFGETVDTEYDGSKPETRSQVVSYTIYHPSTPP
jgi:hypothetical protein